MYAEILAIGDEITSGQLLDTNSQWLSQRLEELGVRTLYHATVGDELAPCVAVFRQAIERSDLVIATGGLGPTADDLTREALAEAVGRPLILRPEALEHIRRLFARRNRPMPERNEIQAMLPEGAQIVPNPDGTAPGIDLEIPRAGRPPCRFICLPGVPAEMRQMWHGTIRDALLSMGAGRQIIYRRTIKCFGAGESQIEAMLPDLIRRGRVPTVGINASGATILLRISVPAADAAEGQRLVEPTTAIIYESLGPLVFGEGDDELEDVVVRLLGQRGQTLSSVELGTAGLVAQWLGRARGPKGCYRGGLVAGDGQTLSRMLGMESDGVIDSNPCGREAVAAMAVACRGRFAADYGLVVGAYPVAVADGATPPPLHFALATPTGVAHHEIPFAAHPDLLAILAAKHSLNMARLGIEKKSRR